MEPTAASLLRAVGEECQRIDAQSGTPRLWLWEQRATLRIDPKRGRTFQLDGGLRREQRGRATFVVGADPTQLTDPDGSGPSDIQWESLATQLGHRLEQELSKAGGIGTVSGRTRLLVAESGVVLEQSVSGITPPEITDRTAPTFPLSASTGRIVLGPSASGWLAHELGHRAIEGGRRDWPPGLTLIDDPTKAPWPTGFEIDDVGNPARPVDLLRSTPCSRRASVREWAVPSMSFTTLDSSRSAIDRLEGEWLGIERVRAGRYDAATDSVFLESDRIYRPDRNGAAVLFAAPTLIVIDSQALSTLAKVDEQGEVVLSSALCTRHESLISVMVGAPTITLDCVQLIPLNSPRGQGNPGVQGR